MSPNVYLILLLGCYLFVFKLLSTITSIVHHAIIKWIFVVSYIDAFLGKFIYMQLLPMENY